MYYQVSASPLVTLQPAEVRVNTLGDGVSTLVIMALGDPNTLTRGRDEHQQPIPSEVGDVLSCQPGGIWQTRPAGADGAYERCSVSGGAATYNPEGPSKPAYVFSLQAVPNA